MSLIALLANNLISTNVFAKTLPIGITLNMSGPNAQSSIDFKNGIEAFIHAENQSKRFNKFQIKLLAMDDIGQANRALSNAKRLITSKNVLALLTTDISENVADLARLAGNNKTLLLSANHHQQPLNIKDHRYIGFLSQPYSEMFRSLNKTLKNSDMIYVSADNDYDFNAIEDAIRSISLKSVRKLTNPRIRAPKTQKNCTIVFANNVNTTANILAELTKQQNQCQMLILPVVEKTLLQKLLVEKYGDTNSHNLLFVSSVPLHRRNLPLIEEFIRDMKAYSPQAPYSHQALKGYLLAKIAIDSMFQSVNKVHTDSFIEIITLPFQLIDQVVGWVKDPNSNISKTTVVNSFSYLKRYDIGLDKTISVYKDRVLIKKTWLSKLDQQQLITNQIDNKDQN
ncbi:ABC transporter substrate-binding protein [Psychrosphaera sp. 1_MG-2023]|uniref:ABC transporter substrate-binding protein n=1 Tax=Psychrosphaera sp. 1_MG-2023 TaxID=3062643 RepID=UPI0026E26BF5|nr:ABC transporter substrate-binding protein [Psychrosphaera sp. 1_MG-2023]MDO6718925.1 ABC transporter substrate-binding protein [Psychrosphaera sp. 1_MG-2023]